MSNKKNLGIDDLLNALKNPDSIDESLKPDKPSLANTRDTWQRIGERDASLANDLGIKKDELNNFLAEWIEDNPYNSIA